MKHPTEIKNHCGTLFKEAQNISNLRYDKLGEFIGEITKYLKQDAKADSERGRPILAKTLNKISRDWRYILRETSGLWVEHIGNEKLFLQNPNYIGNLKQEARDITNLKYDALKDFTTLLTHHFYTKKERAENPERYHKICKRLEKTIVDLENLWEICEPKMKD